MRVFAWIIFSFVVLFNLSTVSNAQQAANIDFDRIVFNATNVSALGGGSVTFTNSNTSVVGTLREGFFGPGNSSTYAGGNLDLRSLYSGQVSISGGSSGVLNGVSYERIYFSGNLNFNAGTISLPYKYSRLRFRRVAPTTLTGNLNIYDRNPSDSSAAPIYTSQLSLQGNVVVTLQFTNFTNFPDGIPKPNYRIHSVRYELQRQPQNNLTQISTETDAVLN